jgi:FKBP-type peptidyl-prolyl cis-trans isomerase
MAIAAVQVTFAERELLAGYKEAVVGKKFLEENGKKKDVITTQSGLQYRIRHTGKGRKPTLRDRVRVHYRGTLVNGTEFDNSIARKLPAVFPVSAVIPGWVEALQLMNEGSKWEVFIPSELAYGERGNPSIPGDSVLIFDIKLIRVLEGGGDEQPPIGSD